MLKLWSNYIKHEIKFDIQQYNKGNEVNTKLLPKIAYEYCMHIV